jgi:hypothetical protein
VFIAGFAGKMEPVEFAPARIAVRTPVKAKSLIVAGFMQTQQCLGGHCR